MTSTLHRPMLRLNPKPTPATKPPKPDRRRRRPSPVIIIEEPILDELRAAMVAAEAELAATGREATQLHETDLPAAVAALRGDERCADLLALLDRARELRQRHRQAYGRAAFWRQKYERTIGDRECASWRVQP